MCSYMVFKILFARGSKSWFIHDYGCFQNRSYSGVIKLNWCIYEYKFILKKKKKAYSQWSINLLLLITEDLCALPKGNTVLFKKDLCKHYSSNFGAPRKHKILWKIIKVTVAEIVHWQAWHFDLVERMANFQIR